MNPYQSPAECEDEERPPSMYKAARWLLSDIIDFIVMLILAFGICALFAIVWSTYSLPFMLLFTYLNHGVVEDSMFVVSYILGLIVLIVVQLTFKEP